MAFHILFNDDWKEKARKALETLFPRPCEPRLVPVRIPVRRPRR